MKRSENHSENHFENPPAKREKMYQAITQLHPKLIEDAQNYIPSKKKKLLRWTAAAAAAVLLTGGIGSSLWKLHIPGSLEPVYAITEAEYPQMAPFPDENSSYEAYDAWSESMAERRKYPVEYTDGLKSFFQRSMQCILQGKPGENVLYSPLNVYMALSMLAELTDEASRSQVLELLGAPDIEALRAQASNIWNATYRQDGAVSSVLGSSIWLNQDISFHQETLERLASVYYASSYQGIMGSPELDLQFQTWLNDQTGGLLEEQIQDISLDPSTVMALAATLYFQSKWLTPFDAYNTREDTFYGASQETTASFMHSSSVGRCFWSDQFTAIAEPLNNNGAMWFFLPAEGVTPEALLENGDIITLLSDTAAWENQKTFTIHKSIPKFDLTSQSKLNAALQTLGVTDVFDPLFADFTPLTEDTSVFIDKVLHDVRVAIDEEGVTAAAYTVMIAEGAMIAENEMDFDLNRPFLFVVTSKDALPLFTGIINEL